jgi:hypothetical protein
VFLPTDGTTRCPPDIAATEHRHRAIDFYSEWKSFYVDYSDRLQRAQIDRPE